VTEEMTETIYRIRALCQRSMAEGEFDYSHNDELVKFCAALSESPSVYTWAPLLFEVIEEFDADVDLTLGSPGPLVHTLEATAPVYEEFLLESMIRKPTGISVWMAKRISRSPGKDKDGWLSKIRDVLKHPEATLAAREMAEEV